MTFSLNGVSEKKAYGTTGTESGRESVTLRMKRGVSDSSSTIITTTRTEEAGNFLFEIMTSIASKIKSLFKSIYKSIYRCLVIRSSVTVTVESVPSKPEEVTKMEEKTVDVP